jgi:hypothetical protein
MVVKVFLCNTMCLIVSAFYLMAKMPIDSDIAKHIPGISIKRLFLVGVDVEGQL